MSLPILYSFRRCPYAMRARLAVHISNVEVEFREILLNNKPLEMLSASAKGTVPVLVLADGSVIDESLDIMLWALKNNDPEQWLVSKHLDDCLRLIEMNDRQFKINLDLYKYAVRFPEKSVEQYRDDCEIFLANLELRLSVNQYLVASQLTLSDFAIFPFIRQFAFVDKNWFEQSDYPYVKTWLKQMLESDLFQSIMEKHAPWESQIKNDY